MDMQPDPIPLQYYEWQTLLTGSVIQKETILFMMPDQIYLGRIRHVAGNFQLPEIPRRSMKFFRVRARIDLPFCQFHTFKIVKQNELIWQHKKIS